MTPLSQIPFIENTNVYPYEKENNPEIKKKDDQEITRTNSIKLVLILKRNPKNNDTNESHNLSNV